MAFAQCRWSLQSARQATCEELHNFSLQSTVAACGVRRGELPMVSELEADGLSLNTIDRRFDEDGIRSRRGGIWTAKAISNLEVGCNSDGLSLSGAVRIRRFDLEDSALRRLHIAPPLRDGLTGSFRVLEPRSRIAWAKELFRAKASRVRHSFFSGTSPGWAGLGDVRLRALQPVTPKRQSPGRPEGDLCPARSTST